MVGAGRVGDRQAVSDLKLLSSSWEKKAKKETITVVCEELREGLMGQASNGGLELLQLRTCRGRWAGRWAKLVEGGNIPSRVSSICKDPRMKAGAGLGTHGSKPQRNLGCRDLVKGI